jgi:hypothetical protein
MKKNAPTGGKGLGTALPWSCWRMIGLQMPRKIKKIVKTCKKKSGFKNNQKIFARPKSKFR